MKVIRGIKREHVITSLNEFIGNDVACNVTKRIRCRKVVRPKNIEMGLGLVVFAVTFVMMGDAFLQTI